MTDRRPDPEDADPESGVLTPRNRTGIADSRARVADMLAAAAEFTPPAATDPRGLARARVLSSKDSRPLGSTPPPSWGDGLCILAPRAGVLSSELRERLVDRLGERLGSERTSVRMYEALLAKYDAGGPAEAPTRRELEQILREEFDNYRMLEEVVAELGGDSTALTPAADLAATLSRGVLEVLLDPRTTFAQCLEAMLIAELMDGEAWRALLALGAPLGEPIISRFGRALATEHAHSEKLRHWLGRGADD